MKFRDDYRDFASLDPRRDEARWEGMIGRVMQSAEPELMRRLHAEPRVLTILSGWARPAFSTTALLAAAAIALLVLQITPEATEPGRSSVLGYPAALADLVEGNRSPSLEELLFSLEGELR